MWVSVGMDVCRCGCRCGCLWVSVGVGVSVCCRLSVPARASQRPPRQPGLPATPTSVGRRQAGQPCHMAASPEALGRLSGLQEPCTAQHIATPHPHIWGQGAGCCRAGKSGHHGAVCTGAAAITQIHHLDPRHPSSFTPVTPVPSPRLPLTLSLQTSPPTLVTRPPSPNSRHPNSHHPTPLPR